MKIRHAYQGTLNGVKGVWSDICPEGLVVEKELTFLAAENPENVLQNKITGKKSSSVIINSIDEQDNWEEVKSELFEEKLKGNK